jgi:transposase InsO family protein/transposase-like protein
MSKIAQQERKKAIKLNLSGEKVSSVCRKLGRSRKWFYKWKKRYESGDPEWFKDQSRAPKNTSKIDDTLESLVIKIRKKLMKKKYAHIGAQAIDWELQRMGIKAHSLSTISRIIKRNNLIKRKSKFQKKGTPYPDLPICGPNTLHQVDFWGPRYITGDGRFYCFNVMDVYTRRVITYPARHKRGQEALIGIIKAWKQLGEPDYIQFDNALSFRGSNRYPRSFNLVIKWCLFNGVQPIFIPVSEPWRNGFIEKFNDTLNKKLFRQIEFDSFNHFCKKLKDFNDYHNHNYRYSPLGGHTPNEVYKRDCISNQKLKKEYKMPEDLPITDGYIHIIRLIRSDLNLNIFGESFSVPESLKYEYVVATICTDTHMIRVFNSQWENLFTIPYKIPNK